jgi:hypothetical protein
MAIVFVGTSHFLRQDFEEMKFSSLTLSSNSTEKRIKGCGKLQPSGLQFTAPVGTKF